MTIVLTALLLMNGAFEAGRGLPRVYVFTATSADGSPSEDERGRLDTVRDLREHLAKEKYKVTLASTREESDVVVEVVSREKNDLPVGGYGGATVGPSGQVVIKLSAKWGSEATEIKGTAAGYWGKAAKDASDRLVKWILRIATSTGKAELAPSGLTITGVEGATCLEWRWALAA
jgi:hypothetical protein